MSQIADNITELIGETPVLRLNRFSAACGCNTPILAKLECFNPGGSVKDRALFGILRAALADGRLQPGGNVIEISAGNQGSALAMLCAAMGLSCTVILPDRTPRTTIERLRRYGANIVYAPASQGLSGCRRLLDKMLKQDHYFVPDAFSNDDNPQAHREGTAQELLRQVGQIDYLVAGVGTGGTVTGCGEGIKMYCPDCIVIAVEPYASPVLSGGFPGSHPLTGIGPGFVAENLNPYILDEVIRVKTPDSLEAVRLLARTEGLICGPSSGAALDAAVMVARRPEAVGKNVVAILPDRGEKYLEKDLERERKQ